MNNPVNFTMPYLVKIPGSKYWELVKPWSVCFSIRSGSVLKLTLRPGWFTDGASVPRFLWPLCGHPEEQPRVAAAIAHDWLYTYKPLPKADADFVYAQISSAMGIPPWRWIIEYLALRMFGGLSWDAHDDYAAQFAAGRSCLEVLS